MYVPSTGIGSNVNTELNYKKIDPNNKEAEKKSDGKDNTYKNQLDKDAFLKLLTTQLKYQDPLSPMEDKEFITQMSSFNALEQMQAVNKNLTGMDKGLKEILEQMNATLTKGLTSINANLVDGLESISKDIDSLIHGKAKPSRTEEIKPKETPETPATE